MTLGIYSLPAVAGCLSYFETHTHTHTQNSMSTLPKLSASMHGKAKDPTVVFTQHITIALHFSATNMHELLL